MKIKRLIVTAAMTSIGALALAGCVQGSDSPNDANSSESKNLTVFISSGTNIQELWQEHLAPAFEKDNPGYTVEVNVNLSGSHDQATVAKLTAATVQGREPDFDLVDGGFVTQIAASGLLTEVSTDNLKPLADIPDDQITAGGNGGIPYRASAVLLAYNTQKVTTPPKTLDDLLEWIKDNPGKFTYCAPDTGGSGAAFVQTVLDKTQSEPDRQKMVTSYVPDLESNWDAGFTTLAGLNPYVFQEGVYPNGNTQALDLLATGQIWMTPVWSDQFTSGRTTGQIPEYVKAAQIADPPFTGGAAYLGIPKASKKQEGALKLAAWVLSPTAQAIIANQVSGFPVIDLSKLPADVQEKFADADTGNLRPAYFASMRNDMSAAWAEKVPGK